MASSTNSQLSAYDRISGTHKVGHPMSLLLLLVALLALDALALRFGVDTRDRGRTVPW